MKDEIYEGLSIKVVLYDFDKDSVHNILQEAIGLEKGKTYIVTSIKQRYDFKFFDFVCTLEGFGNKEFPHCYFKRLKD